MANNDDRIMNVDDKICPLCQQQNSCNVAAMAGCWCMQVKVPQALIDRVPAPVKNKSCICNTCIEQYLKESNK
ncbi:cysteine-rich CWC family protein [Colwellia asteriadis]|uniref:cysteine-rich CWC family protein n=1 Tax=Colwellia asteriadis TaxID=517723 RepID=UPI0031D4E9A7